eukprot:1643583-Heterocapsa_arctica.AAC.1
MARSAARDVHHCSLSSLAALECGAWATMTVAENMSASILTMRSLGVALMTTQCFWLKRYDLSPSRR